MQQFVTAPIVRGPLVVGGLAPLTTDHVATASGTVLKVGNACKRRDTSSMTPTFSMRVSVPTDVLVRELDCESVLLNLESESYFGLDEVGTRMWSALKTTGSIEAAYEAVLAEYDVDPERLRHDLMELIGKLVEHGLVEVSGT